MRSMNDNVLTFCYVPEKPNRLYRVADGAGDESGLWAISQALDSLLDDYDLAYIIDGHKVAGSGGHLQDAIETLTTKGHIDYLLHYTPAELWDEVADNWDELAAYMFGNWAEGHRVEQAYKVAQEKGRNGLAEILSAVLGQKVVGYTARGHNQGEIAEAFVVLEDDAELRHVGSLLDAYLFTRYDLVQFIDDTDRVVAEAVVLDYTPDELAGKTWEEKQKATEQAVLSKLGWGDLAGKVGTARARRVVSYEYEKHGKEEK